MKMEKQRCEIVEYGRKMISSGLVKGTGGNISIFSPEEGCVAISPGSMDYFEITPEDVVLIDLDGNVVDGKRTPSSEWQMHVIFYRNKKNAKSVVHTHSIAATSLSCLRHDLPPIYYLTMAAGEFVKCSGYERFGTTALAKEALKAMGNRNAALLANHGVITCSYSLERAYGIAEQVEFAAELYLRCCSVGKPVKLTPDQVQEMVDVFESFKYKALKGKE